MKPLSHQFLAFIPGFFAVLFVMLAAVPLNARGYSLTPNIAWLMTMVMMVHHPNFWPRGLAFFLGLLQDILFGTPLGSQALLTMLLAHVMSQPYLQAVPLFRLRWIQAAGLLFVWHIALWVIIHLLSPSGPSLRGLLQVSMINVLWYPLIHWFVTRAFANLPSTS